MEIENYREQPAHSSVEAIFDVYLPKIQLRLRNFRVIRTKKGARFVAAPSFSKDGFEGKKEYIPFVEFSKERAEEFNRQVLELLKNFASP